MKLTLDYNTWICGQPSNNSYKNKNNCLGKGSTKMLNKDGYMCCLGQFALQIGLSFKDIEGCESPGLLNKSMPPFNEPFCYDTLSVLDNSDLSLRCIAINDDEFSSIETKVRLLRDALAEHNIQLELVNFPAEIMDSMELCHASC